MKHFLLMCCLLGIATLYASPPDEACAFAGSNIGFARSQTEEAIAKKDINQARYHAYKALNAIEKTTRQLSDCGCDYAVEYIAESLISLKGATRAETLAGAHLLLETALEHTLEGLKALEDHHEHRNHYASDVLTLNTVVTETDNKVPVKPEVEQLHQHIDASLTAYQESLEQISKTLECDRARKYMLGVFEHCEKELLRTDLTEGKRYYNFRTKEITAVALKKLGACSE